MKKIQHIIFVFSIFAVFGVMTTVFAKSVKFSCNMALKVKQIKPQIIKYVGVLRVKKYYRANYVWGKNQNMLLAKPPKGSNRQESHVAWTNEQNYFPSKSSGLVVFRVISKKRVEMNTNQWVTVYICEILKVEAIQISGGKIIEPNEIANQSQKISEIKKLNPVTGIFTTRGFVVSNKGCPSCPPKKVCKPCENRILISEENTRLDTHKIADREMIIAAENPEKFVKGKEYTFQIKIIDKKSTDDTLNDVHIISYTKIK